MDKTDSGSDLLPVPLSILRIRQFSTFPPALKQEVEPIETGGESRSLGPEALWSDKYVAGK